MELSKRWIAIVVRLLGAFFLFVTAYGIAADNGTTNSTAGTAAHLGYPHDWSSRYLVMTGNNDSAILKAGVMEPRQVYNLVKRRAAIQAAKRGRRPGRNPMKVDWAVSLENGFVPAGQYPALFTADITKLSCNSDFVVYSLTVTAGTQANLVGINNLYVGASPACKGGPPWVSFAYNTVTQTGGQITTSPAISEFGGKVAFVETSPAGSFFHVLLLPALTSPPSLPNGTVLSPATPMSCVTLASPGCMTTVQISTGGTPTSPWIDYAADTAYVGTDDGKLYKISPVFAGGAPAVTADADWPVTVVVTPGAVLTDAIVDSNGGRVFVGDSNGYLYAISLPNPAHGIAARLAIGWTTDPNQADTGRGIVDPPFVVTDNANPTVDQVFAFTGCSIVNTIGGAITQVPANFTSTTVVNTANTVDLGSASGRGDCTGLNVHSGFFDNAFWTNGTTNGHIMACGFVSGTLAAPLVPSNPKMYMYPFVNGTIKKGAPTKSWTINNSIGDECSPLTEFFDGTTDRLFFGVGGTSNGSNDGFIKSSSITAGLPASSNCTNGNPTSSCVTAPHKLGGTSGIIVDNQVSNGGTNIYFSTLAPGSVNGQKCNVAGGTANPYCAVKLTQSALQ
jgi:hypothetical protein